MRFSDKAIKALKPKATRYDTYSDDKTGFGIRVTTSGIKTWFTRYKHHSTKKTIRLTFGNYPTTTLSAAKIIHNEHRALIHIGKDPRQLIQTSKSTEANAGTVEELVKEYIERHSKKKKKS